MAHVKFFSGEQVPLEMHKVRIVQKLNLVPVEQRLEAITEAGNNTFLLQNKDVFMDMLTDSGVNAMSDQQQAAMMIADDSYAGSATYTRLERKLNEIFGMDYFLPTHQGRACENILAQTLVTEGSVVPMNYHFTTTKAHITLNGGMVEEIIADKGLEVVSAHPFKGDMDVAKLEAIITKHGADKIAFVRMEAGTNLIGGQPISLQNLADIRRVCDAHNLLLVLDASLLADNLYFLKQREESCKALSIREITRKMADLCDVIYFSARKLGCARGGGICIRSKAAVREDARPGAAVRGLSDLWRHVGARDGSADRGSGRDHGRGHDQPGPAVHRLHGGRTAETRRAGHHPRRRPGLPHRRDAFPGPHSAVAVPGRRDCLGAIYRERRARHGTRHPVRTA